jgi:phosphoribosylformylglycinamidine (FGAM) synthase PurS component
MSKLTQLDSITFEMDENNREDHQEAISKPLKTVLANSKAISTGWSIAI